MRGWTSWSTSLCLVFKRSKYVPPEVCSVSWHGMCFVSPTSYRTSGNLGVCLDVEILGVYFRKGPLVKKWCPGSRCHHLKNGKLPNLEHVANPQPQNNGETRSSQPSKTMVVSTQDFQGIIIYRPLELLPAGAAIRRLGWRLDFLGICKLL